VQEHYNYCNFGEETNQLFAISSRFGNPEEFKELVDKLHTLNIAVVLSLDYSRLFIPASDKCSIKEEVSREFFLKIKPDDKVLRYNFDSQETLWHLLQNQAYFLSEYLVDGFVYRNVSSIIHVNGEKPSSTKERVISPNVSIDGLVFLMLSNELVHSLNQSAITIADD